MKKISKVSAIVFLLYIVIIENTVENLRSRSPEGEKKIARNSEGTVFFKNLLKRNARPPCSWEYGPESGPYSTNLKITPTELRERRVPNVSAKNASRVVRQARQGLSGQCPGALRRPQTTALGALAGLRAHETGGRGFAGARGISQHN